MFKFSDLIPAVWVIGGCGVLTRGRAATRYLGHSIRCKKSISILLYLQPYWHTWGHSTIAITATVSKGQLC
jgi:hypothetical protein